MSESTRQPEQHHARGISNAISAKRNSPREALEKLRVRRPLPAPSATEIELSVIIPTYRRQDTLRQAIDSVLSQRGVRLEVVVIDDCPLGSAEDTIKRIADPRVRYLRNPTHSNGQPAVVRNYGWPQSTGPIIHFMDDDDILAPDIYADAIAAFSRHSNIGLVFGRIEPFGEPSASLDGDKALFVRSARRAARLQALGSARAFTAHLLFLEPVFVSGCTLMRRRCLEELGGLPSNTEIMEDIEFLARATRLYGVRYLNRLALHYRVWPSMMHGLKNQSESLSRSYQRIQANFRRDFGSFDFYLLKIMARTVLRHF